MKKHAEPLRADRNPRDHAGARRHVVDDLRGGTEPRVVQRNPEAPTKKANRERLAFFLNRGGGAGEDRTPDLRIANAALSQLSYGPTMLPEQGADLTMTARMRAIPRAAFFRMHVRCPLSPV